MKEFTAKDVANFYSELESKEIKIWIDGGWAVDALIGEQTRPHGDLDIAIEDTQLLSIKEYLESQDYREVARDKQKMGFCNV